MSLLPSVLSFTHLIGLVLGVGGATVKLVLLLKCKADHAFLPVYAGAVKAITRQIVLGLILLTLSGIGWLLVGYQFTPRLVAKLVLVGAIFLLGPLIDNTLEPKWRKLLPAAGQPPSPAFLRAQE